MREHSDQGSKVIYQVQHAHYSKLAFTSTGRVFLIGGAKTKEDNEVLNETVELVVNQRSGQREPDMKASMEQARTGFGCVVDADGERIYVAGGTIGKHRPTNKAEYYDVTNDQWTVLPSLNEAKFSQSLCLFNEEHLFSFGGFDQQQKPSVSIERLNLR